MKKTWIAVLIVVALLGFAAAGLVWLQNREEVDVTPAPAPAQKANSEAPKLATQQVVTGVDHPWDIAFLSDGAIIYTERAAGVSIFANNQKRLLAKPSDLFARGEAGMMGLAIDPEFSSNRYVYTCFSTTSRDIKLVRWKLSADNSSLTDRKDIVTGMPLNTASGRHSGCRPRFGPDGALWVATGDVAIGTNPQDPKSLGGKVLRIDREGKPIAGNMGGQFDPRIYSYGHRNVQGVAFRGSSVFSVEHGPDKDDEVNVLKPGNYGWNPVPGYNEAVPMTDTQKYPDAIAAVWSSGSRAIAPSGGTFLEGKQWKAYEGALAIAVLKDQHVRILQFNSANTLTDETKVLDSFGRLRIAVQAPDGSLYITTDNGGNKDVIIRVVPQ